MSSGSGDVLECPGVQVSTTERMEPSNVLAKRLKLIKVRTRVANSVRNSNDLQYSFIESETLGRNPGQVRVSLGVDELLCSAKSSYSS